MPAYGLTAAATPTPIAPTTPTIGNGSNTSGLQYPYAPMYQGQSPGVSNLVNQLAKWLMTACQAGAVGSYGVVSGLALSAGSGLNVVMATGIALLDGIVEIVASGAQVPYQANAPVPYGLPDASTSYLFLTQDPTTGAVGIVYSATLAFPANAKIFLGTVVTAAGAISTIDASNVPTVIGGKVTRQTADIGAPTDAPPQMHLETLTTTGVYSWNGTAHVRQEPPPNVQALSGTLTLTPLSSRTQLLDPNGSDRIVELPALTGLVPGDIITIWNQGTAHNLTIQNSAGGAVGGGASLTPGTTFPFVVCTSGGVNAWLASGFSAITPSTGGVVGPGS
jgi:hypothetical protein